MKSKSISAAEFRPAWFRSRTLAILAILSVLLGLLWLGQQVAVQPNPTPSVTPVQATHETGELLPPQASTPASGRAEVHERLVVTGSVIDRDSSAGVGGVHIRMTGAEGSVLTASDGSFSIVGKSSETTITVSAKAPLGWALEKEEAVMPRELVRAGDSVVTFRVHRVIREVITAALIDVVTTEPIPEFAVELISADGAKREARSGADGRLSLGEIGSAVTLRCIDVPELASAWGRIPPVDLSTYQSGQELVTLRIPVGPTYKLKVELPLGMVETDFHCSLESPERGRSTSESEWTPLRGSLDRWVRFAPFRNPPTGGPPWELCVESLNREWFGSALVMSIAGILPTPVEIVIERCGRISGKVMSSTNNPLPGASVYMTVNSVDSEGPSVFRPVSEEGEYKFDRLRPGPYMLAAICSGFERSDQRVVVSSGGDDSIDIVLNENRVLGSISGELRSITGLYKVPVMITLRDESGGNPVHKISEWILTEGRNVAAFRFENIPVGDDYTLMLFPGGGFPWDKQRVRCVCPSDGVVLTCQDDVEVKPVTVRVFDASSTLELPSMWSHHVSLIGEEVVGSGSVGPQPSGSPFLLVVPGRTRVKWIVGAPGFVPAYGDETSFRESEKGDRFMMEVHLEPGWGMELEVKDVRLDGGGPISGVKVVLDGKHIGNTGDDGLVRIQAAARPTSMRLTYKDWKILAGDVSADGALAEQFRLNGIVWMGNP